MARRRDPVTKRLLMEGVHPVVSKATGTVTYRARLSIGSGSSRRHESQTFKTAEAAEEWLSTLQREVRRGEYVGTVDMRVADYYALWLGRMARVWSGSRQKTVTMVWRRYAERFFGAMKLRAVTRQDVQQFVDMLTAEGLANKTIVVYTAGISSMFGAAVGDGYINRSPADRIRMPKAKATKRPIWSSLQLRKFLAQAHDDPLFPIWAFMIATGCRPGEAVAIHWRDIDRDAGTVWIRHTLSRRADGSYAIRRGTKTSDKGRVVSLENWMLEMLPAQGDRQDDDLVFHEDGRPMRPGAVQYRWHKVTDRIGLPRIRMHDIRHSFASAMIASGIGHRVVQEILGHASFRTTMDTYAHVNIESQRKGTQALSELLGLTSPDATTKDEKAQS